MESFNIQDLSNTSKLTGEQCTFIRDQYKRYFDSQNPRARALGYCVISAGISIDEVGDLDIVFDTNHMVYSFNEKISYAIKFRDFAVICRGEGFADVINDYLKSDKRFNDILSGDMPKEPVSFVLFKPGTRSKAERITNCETAMWKAGKAIGLKHSSIPASRYSEGFLTPWELPETMLIPSLNRYRVKIDLTNANK